MTTLNYLKESPSQTAGPYVHIGLTPNFVGIEGVYKEDLGKHMFAEGVKGQRISISGAVYDGGGAVLKDALVEIWQADAEGRYPGFGEGRGKADEKFYGFGRSPSDMATGKFHFETIKPGAVPFRDGRMMAPHVTLWIVARGINIALQTRMYFSDEADANAKDPLLARIEDQSRVKTLIGHRSEENGKVHYHFDIRLQGDNETVFLDI